MCAKLDSGEVFRGVGRALGERGGEGTAVGEWEACLGAVWEQCRDAAQVCTLAVPDVCRGGAQAAHVCLHNIIVR